MFVQYVLSNIFIRERLKEPKPEMMKCKKNYKGFQTLLFWFPEKIIKKSNSFFEKKVFKNFSEFLSFVLKKHAI